MPRNAILEDLRSSIAHVTGDGRRHGVHPFGLDDIDDHLPGNGLATGALHEVLGSPDICDDAAATIFIAGILARMEGPVFWCLRWRDLFTPALDLAGLHPDRLTIVEPGDDKGALIAMEDCLRVAGIAGVVGEVSKLSTTASKRLQLAAEGSGVTAFILRRAAKADALIEGSAAQTRWRVTASPRADLGIPALARPRWSVALERVRGAEPKSWIVEACDAQGRLALPAILVDRPDQQEAWRIAV